MTHRQFRNLFPEFTAPSWRAWNSVEDCLFGIEPEGWVKVSGSTDYFERQKGKPHPSFELDAEGKDRLLMHGFSRIFAVEPRRRR